MIKMMITVVIIYAMCWLPLHTITIIGDRQPEIYSHPYMNAVWICCHWLAMSSCCYNPIVYCWMNSKFRNGFRYALRWCPCVRHDVRPDDMPSMSTCMTTLKGNSDRRAFISAGSRRYKDTYSLCNSQEPTPTTVKKTVDINVKNGHSIHR